MIVNLPITPEKCYRTTLWNAEFIFWWKVYWIPPNVGGCEKSRLCYVATWMWGKQRHSKCSKWPPSAWIHASSLFRHWSVASSTTLCWQLAHLLTSHCCKSSVSRIGTWYTRSCIMPQMQDWRLGTCQDWWTGVYHGTEAWLCHECDVLVHCLVGRPNTNTSPAMLLITGSSSCVGNTSR